MRILCIPDLHIPYHHPKAIQFLGETAALIEPDVVVCLGDEIDAYHFSRFTKDPRAGCASEELREARAALAALYRAFPKVHVCESNHTQRIYKRAAEAGIPGGFLKTLGQLIGAPKGWAWAPHWCFDNILFLHGEGYSGLDGAYKAAERHRTSVALGHLHAFGGVHWLAGYRGSIFGLNCGCLIDRTAVAFDYAKQKARWPTLGCGVILDGVPQFVPLPPTLAEATS